MDIINLAEVPAFTPDEKIARARNLLESLATGELDPRDVSKLLINPSLIDTETSGAILSMLPEAVIEGLEEFAVAAPFTDEGWSRFKLVLLGSTFPAPRSPESQRRRLQWDEISGHRVCAEQLRAFFKSRGKSFAPKRINVNLSLLEALDPDVDMAVSDRFNEAVGEVLLGWRKEKSENGKIQWFFGDQRKAPLRAPLEATDQYEALCLRLFNSHPWKFNEPDAPPRRAKILVTEHLPEPYNFEPSLIYRPVSCVTVIRKTPFTFPWHTKLNEFNEPEFNYHELVRAIECGENFTVPGRGHCDAVCRTLLAALIIQPIVEEDCWLM